MKLPENAPRWLHRAYAAANGYFWLPCPICQDDFGGHERHAESGLMQNFYTSMIVCRNCGDEAKRRNEANDYCRPASVPCTGGGGG